MPTYLNGDRYILGRVLGKGGFCTVRLAIDKSKNKYAVKIFKDS